MRPSLIPTLAWLAAVLLALGPLAAAPARAEPGLTVTVAPEGTIRAAGSAPRGFPLAELRSRVPGIDLSAARQGGTAVAPERWTRALDALTIVLPRIASGEARLSHGRLAVEGRLRPGFSAEATRAAIRLALGSDWKTQFELAEPPPRAALTLAWSTRGAVASGILPAGLAPEAALDRLDISNGRGLTGGGEGDAAAWRRALDRLARLRPAFRHATARLVPGTLLIDGRLRPGHSSDRLERWLAAEMDADWEVSLTGSETPAREGGVRLDPVTGGPQRLVRGHWLPVHEFAPGPAACARRAGAVLAEDPLGFVSGKATLAEGAAPVLDRLAGLARHCLNEGGLALEIGGHTDSRGDAKENRALSERRAMAVLLELVLRGVRADAMAARGYGEAHPVADNDTREGRARNRRITFAWSE